MFGLGKSIAAQDPSYPVYVDTSVMLGNTGMHNGTGFDNIEYMVCTPENKFFPDLSKVGDSHSNKQNWAAEEVGPAVCCRYAFL
jgi:hypothetical protein